MTRLFAIELLQVYFSCKKSKEQNLLHNELMRYRDDLKMSVKAQKIYLSETTYNIKYFKARFDSLNKLIPN